MIIRPAESYDLEKVKNITHNTIQDIYPHYYPAGAVNFFLCHHSEDNIMTDINSKKVYVIGDKRDIFGTVTIKESEIHRLFVLPIHQGKGYGRQLLDFSEQLIAKNFDTSKLAASFPSKAIYVKRGYISTCSHNMLTDNGDYLCYDEMEKTLPSLFSDINYNGKIFIAESISENGEVNKETRFYYHQNCNILWADYAGGEIVRGYLLGNVLPDGSLDFYYQHINKMGKLRIGKCNSTPRIQSNGKLELVENWKWLNGDESTGNSVVTEL